MATALIDEIAVNIRANTAGLSAGLRSASGSVQGFVTSVQKVQHLIFAGLGVHIFERFIESGLSAIRTAEALRRGIGVDRDAFAALSQIAKDADVPIQTVSRSMLQMSRRLQLASQGGGALAKSLAAAGIEMSAFVQLSPIEQLRELAEVFDVVKKQGVKASLARDLFGKFDPRMFGFLRGVSDEFDAVRKGVQDLGLSLSEDQVRAAHEADTAITRLSATWRSFKNQLVSEIVPSVTSGIESITEAIRGLGGLRDIVQGLVLAFRSLVAPLQIVGGKDVGAVLHGVFDAATSGTKAGSDFATSFLDGVKGDLQGSMADFGLAKRKRNPFMPDQDDFLAGGDQPHKIERFAGGEINPKLIDVGILTRGQTKESQQLEQIEQTLERGFDRLIDEQRRGWD